MVVPCVKDVAHDRRLIQIAQEFLGATAIPYRATLLEKIAGANWLVPWHQDTALPLREYCDSPEWGPWSEKAGIKYAHAPAWALEKIVALRLHLDASTPENGPLRVVPDTDHLGVLEDDEVRQIVRTRTAVECLIPQGGVLSMRPLLIHASSKARTSAPRRVLHIEYSPALQLAPGIELQIA
jgi:ectoine hydroxylase-related dioxygenase (phytanoyl-CoA dioxygenase family)